MSTTANQRIVVLDGLRGLAAISVMLMHDAGAYGETSWFEHAYSAVDMFFLLSGFVLTLNFERRFAAGMSAKTFVKLRVKRLWWIVAIGIALGSAYLMGAVAAPALIVALCASLLFIPAPLGTGQVYGLNAPVWSVTCELVANAFHVLWLRFMDDRGLIALCGGFGLLFALYVVIMGTGDTESGVDNWPAGLFRIGYSYPLGVLMGRHWRQHRVAEWPWWLALIVPMAAIILIAPWAHNAWVDIPFTLFAMPAIFWFCAHASEPSRGAVPALVWLGAVSYPVYAFNWPLIRLGTALQTGLDSTTVRIAALLATLGLAYAAALIEQRQRSAARAAKSPATSNLEKAFVQRA